MDLPWVPENFSRVQRDASNPSLVAVATSGEAAQNHFTSGKKKKREVGGGEVTSQLETANLPCSEAGRFPVAWNKFRTRWKRRTSGHICKLEVFMDV